MCEQGPIGAAEEEDLRGRFLGVDTSNVADVLDKMGLPDQGLAAAFPIRRPPGDSPAGPTPSAGR